MKEFYENNKKVLNRIFIILGIIIVLYLVWVLFISKNIIFNKQVKNIEEAGSKYFSTYSTKLPTKDNDVVTVSAKELLEKKFASSSDLYIPKTKKSCDLDNSWVKARRENGKIVYYTYLKCGSYENSTDHTGPVITLNDGTEVSIDVGSTYSEAGVKSVVDDNDGKMDTSKVTIKKVDIDTSKVGTYTISYIAYDSLYNKSEVKRTVKVVRKLEGIIKEDTNNKNYYVGSSVNNYVLFSGIMWRIVGLNDDGTVKLVTAKSISNLTYGKEKSYKKSNIYKWLNDYFYDHIENNDYIVNSKWCISNVSSSSETGCNKTQKAKVGLLTLNEVERTKEDDSTYLASGYMSSEWLLNRKSNDKAYVLYGSSIEEVDAEEISTVSPVVNIKKDLTVSSGEGSIYSPYVIGDYKTGKSNSKLNDRIIGEYVYYSGHNFRIMEKNKDNTVLIMVDTTDDTMSYDEDTKEYKYNIDTKGNLGYNVEKSASKYLVKDDRVVKREWTNSEFDKTAIYNKTDTYTFKSKYAMPRTYEMFSAQTTAKAWLMDYSKTKGNIVFTGPGGLGFDLDTDEGYTDNAVRFVIELNDSTKISSGNGLEDDPYTIK